VVLYLRRKVSSLKTKTVFLAVSLAEALVKNCGQRVHAAIGADYSSSSFMRDMVRAAKRYHGKSNAEAVEVSELLLDVIQAWGEAFLVMRAQYPGFVQAYHDLRKEGQVFIMRPLGHVRTRGRPSTDHRPPVYSPPPGQVQAAVRPQPRAHLHAGHRQRGRGCRRPVRGRRHAGHVHRCGRQRQRH